MNTRNILNKIKYEELMHLDNNEFFLKVMLHKRNLYSDLNFIHLFKDKGIEFWAETILFTHLPINSLFKYFKCYLINRNVFNIIQEEKKSLQESIPSGYKLFYEKNVIDYENIFNKEIKKKKYKTYKKFKVFNNGKYTKYIIISNISKV